MPLYRPPRIATAEITDERFYLTRRHFMGAAVEVEAFVGDLCGGDAWRAVKRHVRVLGVACLFVRYETEETRVSFTRVGACNHDFVRRP